MTPRRLLAAAAAFAALALGAAPALAQERWCDSYLIQRGDTLSQLALQVYGEFGDFMRFYDDPRNADSLGTNPNRIAIGDVLYLPPCVIEGTPLTAIDRDIDLDARPIDVVTASDFAPFTHEELPERGMLTRVVAGAFALSGLTNEVRIDFVNDWGSHLETLLPRGKYTFGFPWYRPDCENRERLSEAMQRRCDLLWSEPVFSVVIGFYAPSTLENPPADFAALQGSTICRPAGYFTFDLEQEGLTDGETIKLVQPPSVIDCFEALDAGSVDFVSINRFTADRAIAEAGLRGFVEPIATVVSTQDLHLVAHPFDGDAARWLEAFNAGLRELKRDGRYARISNRFLEAHQREIEEIASRE